MSSQRGSTMIETLVTILIVSFAMIGVAGMQYRAARTELDSYQRSQATILLGDMAARITANRGNAAAYVAEDVGAEPQDCAGLGTVAQADLCAWGALLRGARERQDGREVGALVSGLGCVRSPEPNLFVITIAWQGMVTSGAAQTDCGVTRITDAELRRSVSTVVRIASLGT